ncbi:MAG: aminopeptidase, partial [Bacteroidales bacterium]|nr:aminopeptidase [Bacteroidales bacterium]
MNRILRIAAAAILAAIFASCSKNLLEDGVSLELAQHRDEVLSNLEYDLSFDIPESEEDSVSGCVTIDLDLASSLEQLVIDYKNGQIDSVVVEGESVVWNYRNEHIIIPSIYFSSGHNQVKIWFRNGDSSLNRRDGFVYTLSVPDRARTLFPCFDQPSLKARYKLSLTIPEGWCAVSNSPVNPAACRTLSNENGKRSIISFHQSEPLSTYLFAFVAGRFTREEMTQGKNTIGLYHRETDPYKKSQCRKILSTVHECIKWMEDYTGINYPFAKYDLIILPGFQFGGMEHTGATLYNDTRMFLNKNAGVQEEMSRFSLIAHETAHMWFGDLVTMKWFDDVWTKEIFANYFAAQMTSEKFPEVDRSLNFASYIRSAFEEDRTDGATPIKQPLDNMNNAGLMYSNIIYNKAPVVMEMLAEKCGREAFREGVREYLKKYSYSNATWEDLIAVLDSKSSEDLKSWSSPYIYEAGIPTIKQSIKGDLPVFDTLCYGYYKLPYVQAEKAMSYAMECEKQSDKGFILINVNENALQGRIPTARYIDFLLEYLDKERDPVLYSWACSYLQRYHFLTKDITGGTLDKRVWKMLESNPDKECCRSAYSLLTTSCYTTETTEKLLEIFDRPNRFTTFQLSESQLTSLAYELAVRIPERADSILMVARGRISNPDRIAQFDFISPAVSPSEAVRDSVFESLLLAENRAVEPWTVTSMRLLNHPLRSPQSEKYILPAIGIIEEIQATGDIFLPKNWASALLSGHKGDT